MKYVYNGISLQNKRQTNMDSLLLKEGAIDGQGAALAVVCDGVGSLKDGEFASGEAVRMLGKWFAGLESHERIGLKMRDAVIDISAQIAAEAASLRLETASTLSALLIAQGAYYIVHIGDSRVYSFENGAMAALTSDDASETGALTACIGRARDIFPQYTEGPASGKAFLVCSDGAYKRADPQYLREKVAAWTKKPSQKPIDEISKFVIARGERDNITLALIKIKGT